MAVKTAAKLRQAARVAEQQVGNATVEFMNKEELEKWRNWRARAEKCDYDQAVILADEILRSTTNHDLRSGAWTVRGMCKPVRNGTGSAEKMARANNSIGRLQRIIEEVIEKSV